MINNPAPSLTRLLTPPMGLPRALALLTGCCAIGAVLVAVGLPIWGGAVAALALLALPALRTWQSVGDRFGVPLMVLAVLLYLQGFHTIEHIVQWAQFHILGWAPRRSTGLLSGLNVEVVHFLWNWSVFLTTVYLLRAGLRSGPGNVFGWLFIGWSGLHTLEHTYLMIQYLSTVQALWATGGSLTFAEGLPGILGRNGWLDNNGSTNGITAFVCSFVPAVVLTPRLDIHFFWNTTEALFMLAFAAGAVRKKAAPITMSAAGVVSRV